MKTALNTVTLFQMSNLSVGELRGGPLQNSCIDVHSNCFWTVLSCTFSILRNSRVESDVCRKVTINLSNNIQTYNNLDCG